MSEKKAKKKTATKKAAPKKTAKKAAPKKSKKKEETTVKEGSLIYVDYVAKTKDDGTIFDLTLEEVAKAEGLYSEKDRYEPILVAVGSNWLLEAIEEGLVDMKIDESKKINVPPERGAGVRDPSLVKKIAKIRLEKQGVRIQKGERVTVGREQGVITQVLGRTAILDFNPPLAGKTLVFDVTVKGIVSEPNDKIMAVLKRRLPGVPPEKYSVSVKGKTITIEFPKESRYIQDFQYAEIGVAMDALKVISKADKVKMIVTYDRPEAPPATEETSD
ncbi:MAG: FKBP-type peptidyl-prolyl cis-trans isomerase [Candidatus Thorarchaeota archaeon]|jgi:FKBP-type peptidyl-prolyl cis-trans isomerase 2